MSKVPGKPVHQQMQRLYLAAKKSGIVDQAGMATAFKTTSGKINNWEARGISKQGMIQAEKMFGCSSFWLATGEGPMYRDIKDQEPPLAVSDASDQTIELSKDDYTEIVNQDDTDESSTPAKGIIYSKSIQAVIDAMLKLDLEDQGHVKGRVLMIIKDELTLPIEKDKSQKVDGLTGTHS